MRSRLVFGLIMSLGIAAGNPIKTLAEAPPERPSLIEIQMLIERHFATQPHLRSGNIISQKEARSLFSTLEAAGWEFEGREELLHKLLPDGDPLIAILRSPDGTKFMGQVANEKLIYDRLDRIVREPGGQRLLADLIKLPNAARYAKHTTHRGVPDLEDFLPKDRTGKARHIKDYDKPTEKIYTVTELKNAMEKVYEAAGHNPGV